MIDIGLHTSIGEIPAWEWQQLENPNFPFTDHDHLLALERTGCVGPESGWVPIYLSARKAGSLEAATFFYIKNNSWGEFIFDFAWAQAYARNGIAYYPKLVSSIPFTPATGEKMLVRAGSDGTSLRAALLEAILAFGQRSGCSSAHFLFIPKDSVADYERAGMLIRHSSQFHWKNHNYESFAHFLGSLTSKRRRQVLLERRQLAAHEGLEIETVTGPQLNTGHAELMYHLYQDTNLKNHSPVCLTPSYFEWVMSEMNDRVVLMTAKKGGNPVAASIHFKKGNALYGRYWGSFEEVKFLHFELCYYRAIEYAIDEKLVLFEAGAQGEHKFSRGFLPELIYSAHEIWHPGFRPAIERYIAAEKVAIEEDMSSYLAHSPFDGARRAGNEDVGR